MEQGSEFWVCLLFHSTTLIFIRPLYIDVWMVTHPPLVNSAVDECLSLSVVLNEAIGWECFKDLCFPWNQNEYVNY